MNLTPGTKLGPYEILSPLGAGGMGEVYRARDTRLGRDVAIKVLPQHLSQHPEVRARFEREARTVSSLNHPNICTLHDVGREGDVDYLVMELVDGETLADRLAKGPLPLPDTLRIAGQIADALDRAHRAGVVHRDLKPGNVMLTKAGAKLMDFGLARATGMAGPGGDSGVTMAALTQSPTIGQPLTAEGTIVGTFQYMSPEQLEGKETDARSDLWAFGCVVYEMATGKRAFEGKSQASLIGAIMHAEPAPISQLAPATPPELDRLVRACLVKDADDRVQSAHDLKLQLKWLAEGAPTTSSAGSTAVPVPRAPTARGRKWTPAILAGVLGILIGVGAMLVLRGANKPATSTGSPEHYIVGSFDLKPDSPPTLTPDGSAVILSILGDARPHLFRRNLSAVLASPIPGTEGGFAPFFSPDGNWLGFMTDNAIKKVPFAGGIAQTVLTDMRVNSADWSKDGWIYFAPYGGGPDGRLAIGRVPANGGTVETIAHLDSAAAEGEAWTPEVLADGTVMFSVVANDWHLYAVSPGKPRKPVLKNAVVARFLDGFLFYQEAGSGAVLAVPFDPARQEISGVATPLTVEVDDVYAFDVHRNGKLIYVPVSSTTRPVVWLQRDGTSTPVVTEHAIWAQPRMSPDGRRLVVRKVENNCELWMYDIEQDVMARIVQGGDNHDPVWSPDGRHLVYRRSDSVGDIRMITIDGAPQVTTIVAGPNAGSPNSWSRGGNRLAFTRNTNGKEAIYTVVMDGSSTPEIFLETRFNEVWPALSPDGNWMAYASDETGSAEIYVRRFPDDGTAWRLSIGGGRAPFWSRDGRRLYYSAGVKLMVSDIVTSPSFQASAPRVVLDGGFGTARANDIDVATDGRFVAVARNSTEAGATQVRILTDWRAERARVEPAGH